MHCVAGIDPGVTGAVAVLQDGAGSDPRLFLFDLPIHKVKVGKTLRKRIDVHGLVALMLAVKTVGVSLVILEDVGGMTGQSASAAFSFGKTCGCIEAATVSAMLPLQPVTPQVWKRKLGVPADKDGARQAASRAFPRYAGEWSRPSQDGRAEAALLALYAARHVQSWA